MSKLILICGLPGSGKTTLAKELSKKINIVCLHKDSIKEKLFETQKGKTLEDSQRIGNETINVLFHLIEEQIKNGVDLIAEAPFNFPEDYSQIAEWENNYEVNIFSIICQIDSEERKKRFNERERHTAHFDREVFERHFQESEYDYKDIPGNQIRINTDEPVKILTQKIIKKII